MAFGHRGRRCAHRTARSPCRQDERLRERAVSLAEVLSQLSPPRRHKTVSSQPEGWEALRGAEQACTGPVPPGVPHCSPEEGVSLLAALGEGKDLNGGMGGGAEKLGTLEAACPSQKGALCLSLSPGPPAGEGAVRSGVARAGAQERARASSGDSKQPAVPPLPRRPRRGCRFGGDRLGFSLQSARSHNPRASHSVPSFGVGAGGDVGGREHRWAGGDPMAPCWPSGGWTVCTVPGVHAGPTRPRPQVISGPRNCFPGPGPC